VCGRPIRRSEGKSLPFVAVTFAQCPRLSELRWSDQEVNLYPVHPRMQKHWGHVTTGDISRVNLIEGTSCVAKRRRPSEEGQEGKEEPNEK